MEIDSKTAAGNVLTTKYNPAASQKVGTKKRKKVDKKFKAKVKEALSDDIGTIQCLRQLPVVNLTWGSWLTSINSGQTTNSFSLFTGAGTGPYHNDMLRLFQSFTDVNEREAATLNIKSGIIDVVFINDQLEDGLEARFPGSLTTDIDIYECVCIRDVPLSVGATPQDIVSNGMADYTVPYVGSGSVSSTSLGATPFQSPLFSRHFKIFGKQKIYLSPGDSSHVEYKTSFSNKKVSYKRIESNLALAGITKVYIVVANNTGRNAVDTAGFKALRVYQTKRLTYESEYNMIPQANIDN